MEKLETLPQWVNLKKHYRTVSKLTLRELFSENPQRFTHFSVNAAGLLLDYSKNRLVSETINQLCQLAVACKLPEKISELFNGALINASENQPALHTALRDTTSPSIWVNQQDILIEIQQNLEKMSAYAENIRQKQWTGYNGKPITDVVNIGIDGSDLGPAMVCDALSAFKSSDIRCHFVSNTDNTSIANLLKTLRPATTLFIISSKSFSTKETLLNAKSARHWLTHTIISSCLSQSRALMLGKSYSEAYTELLSMGYSKKVPKQLAPHKTVTGNRPSNTLILRELTPYSLGALLALYEHKVFVQSVIWHINCFDQWGIELGKQITDNLLTTLKNKSPSAYLDSSTQHLLNLYMESKLL